MSFLLVDTFSSTTRETGRTITGGTFTNVGGKALLEASTGTWVTSGVRVGDYVRVAGTLEVSRVTAAAATSVSGGESFKFYNGDDSRSYVLWFTKGGSGTAPTVTTETLLGPVNVTVGQSASTIASNIRNALSTSGSSTLSYTTFFKDFTVGGSGTNCDITCKMPGNCTGIALFSGTLTGWSFTTTTSGATASANDGIYRVEHVLSNTAMILEQAWPSPGGAVAGTATVYVSDNRLIYTDETTITCADIETDCASKTIFGKIPTGITTTWPWNLWRSNLYVIKFDHTGSTNTEFNLANDILMCMYGSGADPTLVSIDSADPGTLTVNAGNAGSDAKSFSQGCVLAGVNFSVDNTDDIINLNGVTYLQGTSASNQSILGGYGTSLSCSSFHGLPPLFGNVGNYATFNNCIASYEGYYPVILTEIDFSDNILISDSTASGFLFATGEFTVTGLDLGADVYVPLFNMFAGTTPHILDPFQDFTEAQLYTGSGGTGTKEYTFNPRFVFRDIETRAPLPIEDLNVDITKIGVDRYITVTTNDAASTYRTTINGTNIDAAGNASISTTTSNIVTAINSSGVASVVTAVVLSGALGTIQIKIDDSQSDVELSTSVIGGSGVFTTTAQTEASVGTYSTNSSGYINSGAGVILERFKRESGIVDHYKYNILIEGGSIKTRRFYYVPRRKFTDDIVFDVQQFDLEGELGA